MTPTETLPAALAEDASPPEAKRPRGRPRKTEDERDDGNRRHQLLQVAANGVVGYLHGFGQLDR